MFADVNSFLRYM